MQTATIGIGELHNRFLRDMNNSQTTPRPLQVGDYVRVPSHVSDNICKITAIYQDRATIYDGETCGGVPVGIMELVSKREVFLSRLQSLLREFDASISVFFDQSDEIYYTTINIGDESVKYSYTNGVGIYNVADYAKE